MQTLSWQCGSDVDLVSASDSDALVSAAASRCLALSSLGTRGPSSSCSGCWTRVVHAWSSCTVTHVAANEARRHPQADQSNRSPTIPSHVCPGEHQPEPIATPRLCCKTELI